VLSFIERHVVGCLVGAVVVVFLLYEASAQFYAYSGDAFVDGDVVYVAPEVSGPVARISVSDDARVKPGDLIAEIDPTPFQLALNAAQAEIALANLRAKSAEDALAESSANLAAALAASQDADSERGRIEALFRTQDVSAEAMESARSRAAEATAELSKARSGIVVAEDDAAVQRAASVAAARAFNIKQYELQRTRIVSPVAGRVAPLTFRVGDMARAGEPLAAVVSATNWRINAAIPERHLAKMKVGQQVWFTIGSDPWRVHVGSIRAIAPGVSRRDAVEKVLPFVPLDLDWIRLPRRFPVLIDIGGLEKTLPLYRGADARVLVWF
jgi:membrane fusion protein, multidrug efflux system